MVKVVQDLTDISEIVLPELSAIGNTPMGQTFEFVKNLIEDKNIVSSRAYTPTIVLISDGLPTDCSEEMYYRKNYFDWLPLKDLHASERAGKCQRLALGIGDDVDTDMLKTFIDNPEIPVIKTKDANGIGKFFRWVTMSTVARMNSVNPNEIAITAPFFDIDDEDILI